jgi:hypothetical protein
MNAGLSLALTCLFAEVMHEGGFSYPWARMCVIALADFWLTIRQIQRQVFE